MTQTLKKVEAAGLNHEVILYFNVCVKPHKMVLEEMDRFLRAKWLRTSRASIWSAGGGLLHPSGSKKIFRAKGWELF